MSKSNRLIVGSAVRARAVQALLAVFAVSAFASQAVAQDDCEGLSGLGYGLDVIRPCDPSTYNIRVNWGMRYTGWEYNVPMYHGNARNIDRSKVNVRAQWYYAPDRPAGWLNIDLPTFELDLGWRKVKVRVWPDIEWGEAFSTMVRMGTVLGQMPRFMVPVGDDGFQTLILIKNSGPWGGADGGLLADVDSLDSKDANGITEEVTMHELAHAVLDEEFYSDPWYRWAMNRDGTHVSNYARQYPDREDVAETIVPWYASRFVPDRCDPALVEEIERVMPNRLRFFDWLLLQ